MAECLLDDLVAKAVKPYLEYWRNSKSNLVYHVSQTTMPY